MEVSSPPGTVIGSIEQDWSICKPCYSIKNAAGDIVLRIKGPCCTYSICGDVEFHVSISLDINGSAYDSCAYILGCDYWGAIYLCDPEMFIRSLGVFYIQKRVKNYFTSQSI